MSQSNDSIAVMLLCCRMSATRQELFDPLSPQEYHALEQTLSKKLKTTPGWMFGRDIGEMMQELEVSEQEAHRLVVLMERMVSLSYEMDNYARRGIEIITCVDRRYPLSLSRRLGVNAPPVIYVCGNMNLFREPTLAFAGSVPGEEATERETKLLADRCAQAGIVFASGATSGLDQTAEERLLENGGRLIAWLPGGMFEAVEREGLAQLIHERRAVACSVVHPGAAVQSNNARARSKCLYATGTVSYVLGCEHKRGDTWDGAAEALRNRYTERMYAWETDLFSGNAMLIKRGANALPGVEKLDLGQLRTRWMQEEGEQLSVFDDRHLLY